MDMFRRALIASDMLTFISCGAVVAVLVNCLWTRRRLSLTLALCSSVTPGICELQVGAVPPAVCLRGCARAQLVVCF